MIPNSAMVKMEYLRAQVQHASHMVFVVSAKKTTGLTARLFWLDELSWDKVRTNAVMTEQIPIVAVRIDKDANTSSYYFDINEYVIHHFNDAWND